MHQVRPEGLYSDVLWLRFCLECIDPWAAVLLRVHQARPEGFKSDVLGPRFCLECTRFVPSAPVHHVLLCPWAAVLRRVINYIDPWAAVLLRVHRPCPKGFYSDVLGPLFCLECIDPWAAVLLRVHQVRPEGF